MSGHEGVRVSYWLKACGVERRWFADYLGISYAALGYRLRGEDPWTRAEAEKTMAFLRKRCDPAPKRHEVFSKEALADPFRVRPDEITRNAARAPRRSRTRTPKTNDAAAEGESAAA